MKIQFILYNLFLLFPFFLKGQILPFRPATALNKVILYQDSSFFDHSSVVYEEGALFSILGESRFEHEDAAQNQKFKWYYVRTPDQKKGWIFGDGIAVIQPADEINGISYKYHLKEIQHDNCLLYTSPSPRDATLSRMPSSA